MHLAGRAIVDDFRTGGDVAALFGAAGNAKALSAPGLSCPSRTACAAASRTARNRASLRFLRRNSSGSIFTAWARSSMWDSRAKWLAVAASRDRNPACSGECHRGKRALVRNFIEGRNGRAARIIVVKFPGGDCAVTLHAGSDIDDARRDGNRPR